MSVQTDIRRGRDHGLELQAINGTEHRLLINLATPERDSLAEDIMALRAYNVPNAVLSAILGRLADAIDLNAAEGACERELTGLLDGLTTPSGRRRVAAENGGGRETKTLARQLSPALRVLGRPEAYVRDVATLVAAAGVVSSVLVTAAPSTIGSAGLRNELGAHAHDLLLRLRDGVV